MPNFAVLLVKNSATNPEGLPAEWFMDIRGPVQALDPALQVLGYQLMTDVEMAQRNATYGTEFQTYQTTTQSAKDTTNNNKIKALRDLFDAGDAIDAAWSSATNPQKMDLGRTAWQIVRKYKQAILDTYRP